MASWEFLPLFSEYIQKKHDGFSSKPSCTSNAGEGTRTPFIHFLETFDFKGFFFTPLIYKDFTIFLFCFKRYFFR